MLSPRVQDLVERCRHTQQAAATYAPLIEELSNPRPPEQDGGAEPYTEGVFKHSVLQLGVEEVGTAADAAAEADRAHSRAVEVHQEWAGRRDGLAGELYREVAGFRKAWRELEGKKIEGAPLGLSGKTPRRTSDLMAWARRVPDFWGDGKEFSMDRFLRRSFEARIAATRTLVAEVETAYDEAGKANLNRRTARDQRRQTIEECESLLKENGRIIEAFLGRAGCRDLMVKIRGKQPRGRPCKSDPPRSKPRPKPAAVVAAAPQGRVLYSWFERAAQKAGRLFRREGEERRDLRRAA